MSFECLRNPGIFALTLLKGLFRVRDLLLSDIIGEVSNLDVSGEVMKILNVFDYYSTGQFVRNLTNFQKDNNRRTGYANMDKVQGLYSGLYVLGAISSLGKTTFCHQMADQLALAGETVLYFTLEQNYFELFSKSLSRYFYQCWKEDSTKPLFSSVEVRRGVPQLNHAEYFEDRVQEYVNLAGKNLNVIECNFSATIENITELIEKFMQKTGKKPVVIIDYLQIIAPTLINGYPNSSKANIDHIVHSLKCFQSVHNLVVIVISSLNRQNYMTPMDFESFKESGGIEYTADVIWGLQLSVINDEIFSKEGRIKEKREIIHKAKVSNPRLIQLVCLKNRYGISNYVASFDYYPAYDVFEPYLE